MLPPPNGGDQFSKSKLKTNQDQSTTRGTLESKEPSSSRDKDEIDRFSGIAVDSSDRGSLSIENDENTTELREEETTLKGDAQSRICRNPLARAFVKRCRASARRRKG
jgi:hypothetical protein